MDKSVNLEEKDDSDSDCVLLDDTPSARSTRARGKPQALQPNVPVSQDRGSRHSSHAKSLPNSPQSQATTVKVSQETGDCIILEDVPLSSKGKQSHHKTFACSSAIGSSRAKYPVPRLAKGTLRTAVSGDIRSFMQKCFKNNPKMLNALRGVQSEKVPSVGSGSKHVASSQRVVSTRQPAVSGDNRQSEQALTREEQTLIRQLALLPLEAVDLHLLSQDNQTIFLEYVLNDPAMKQRDNLKRAFEHFLKQALTVLIYM